MLCYMIVLVLDTETTGLLPKTPDGAYPHIVQLSMRTYDTKTRAKNSTNIILNPGVEIPAASIAVHGITNERAQQEGIPPVDALTLLALEIDNADVLVCHNLEYDTTVVAKELERNGLVNVLKKPKMEKYCTMKCSKTLCNIVARSKRTGRPYIKYPTLSELYQKLFGAAVVGLHDAHMDTAVTLRCYLRLALNIDILPQELGIQEDLYAEHISHAGSVPTTTGSTVNC